MCFSLRCAREWENRTHARHFWAARCVFSCSNYFVFAFCCSCFYFYFGSTSPLSISRKMTLSRQTKWMRNESISNDSLNLIFLFFFCMHIKRHERKSYTFYWLVAEVQSFLILSKHGFYCTRINLSSNFTCHALDMLKPVIFGFFTTFFSCQVQLLHFTVLFLLHCNQAYTVLCRVAISLTPAISVFLKSVLCKQKEPITFNKENFEQKSSVEVCICWRQKSGKCVNHDHHSRPLEKAFLKTKSMSILCKWRARSNWF